MSSSGLQHGPWPPPNPSTITSLPTDLCSAADTAIAHSQTVFEYLSALSSASQSSSEVSQPSNTATDAAAAASTRRLPPTSLRYVEHLAHLALPAFLKYPSLFTASERQLLAHLFYLPLPSQAAVAKLLFTRNAIGKWVLSRELAARTISAAVAAQRRRQSSSNSNGNANSNANSTSNSSNATANTTSYGNSQNSASASSGGSHGFRNAGNSAGGAGFGVNAVNESEIDQEEALLCHDLAPLIAITTSALLSDTAYSDLCSHSSDGNSSNDTSNEIESDSKSNAFVFSGLQRHITALTFPSVTVASAAAAEPESDSSHSAQSHAQSRTLALTAGSAAADATATPVFIEAFDQAFTAPQSYLDAQSPYNSDSPYYATEFEQSSLTPQRLKVLTLVSLLSNAALTGVIRRLKLTPQQLAQLNGAATKLDPLQSTVSAPAHGHHNSSGMYPQQQQQQSLSSLIALFCAATAAAGSTGSSDTASSAGGSGSKNSSSNGSSGSRTSGNAANNNSANKNGSSPSYKNNNNNNNAGATAAAATTAMTASQTRRALLLYLAKQPYFGNTSVIASPNSPPTDFGLSSPLQSPTTMPLLLDAPHIYSYLRASLSSRLVFRIAPPVLSLLSKCVWLGTLATSLAPAAPLGLDAESIRTLVTLASVDSISGIHSVNKSESNSNKSNNSAISDGVQYVDAAAGADDEAASVVVNAKPEVEAAADALATAAGSWLIGLSAHHSAPRDALSTAVNAVTQYLQTRQQHLQTSGVTLRGNVSDSVNAATAAAAAAARLSSAAAVAGAAAATALPPLHPPLASAVSVVLGRPDADAYADAVDDATNANSDCNNRDSYIACKSKATGDEVLLLTDAHAANVAAMNDDDDFVDVDTVDETATLSATKPKTWQYRANSGSPATNASNLPASQSPNNESTSSQSLDSASSSSLLPSPSLPPPPPRWVWPLLASALPTTVPSPTPFQAWYGLRVTAVMASQTARNDNDISSSGISSPNATGTSTSASADVVDGDDNEEEEEEQDNDLDFNNNNNSHSNSSFSESVSASVSANCDDRLLTVTQRTSPLYPRTYYSIDCHSASANFGSLLPFLSLDNPLALYVRLQNPQLWARLAVLSSSQSSCHTTDPVGIAFMTPQSLHINNTVNTPLTLTVTPASALLALGRYSLPQHFARSYSLFSPQATLFPRKTSQLKVALGGTRSSPSSSSPSSSSASFSSGAASTSDLASVTVVTPLVSAPLLFLSLRLLYLASTLANEPGLSASLGLAPAAASWTVGASAAAEPGGGASLLAVGHVGGATGVVAAAAWQGAAPQRAAATAAVRAVATVLPLPTASGAAAASTATTAATAAATAATGAATAGTVGLLT